MPEEAPVIRAMPFVSVVVIISSPLSADGRPLLAGIL
jgi:hypothetical protein